MVDIVSEGITTIHVRGIDSNTSYVTCQIHSHFKKLTLSSSPSRVDGESLIGYNIGMITVLETNQTDVQWFIISNYNEEFRVLVAVFTMSDNVKNNHNFIKGLNGVNDLLCDSNTILKRIVTCIHLKRFIRCFNKTQVHVFIRRYIIIVIYPLTGNL